MNISDLPFLTEEATIPELADVSGGVASGKDFFKSIINPLPPGIPEGSKFMDAACTNSIPGSCIYFYKTPSGEIKTYSPPKRSFSPVNYL